MDSSMLRTKPKILTVGDGDLSLSLALSRAYGGHVDVTASVLESDRQQLLKIFPEAPLDELKGRGVEVMFGVDATQLHTLNQKWDLISFHHPHLGISNVEDCDEAKRAILHHRLLCHFLHSAKQVSRRVNVCLTGTQPTTWKLVEAANRQNLALVESIVDSKPFAHIWMDPDDTGTKPLPEPAKAEPKFAAPRKYRNGKLGRHFLARYGYRHRRTEGVMFKGSIKDANVSESMHFVFAQNKEGTHDEAPSEEGVVCPICMESFESESALELHLNCPVRPPAMPKVAIDEVVDDENAALFKTQSKEFLNAKDTKKSEPEMVLEQRHDENGGIVLIVPSRCDGKRLRWFLQHSNIQNLKFTKRLAESTIQAGIVSVNGEVARDSGRILKEKDTVAIQNTTATTTTKGNTFADNLSKLAKKNHPTIEIVERSPPTSSIHWLVAVKPSGIRTKGQFSGTLESIVSEQEEKPYTCLSSLETSCAGLCVLMTTTTTTSGTTNISVLHTMTVLVHGRIASGILSRNAKLVVEQKWKKKKKRKLPGASTTEGHHHQSEEEEEEEEEQQQQQQQAQATVQARIDVLESTEGESSSLCLSLSTLKVATTEPSSGSICHYFRQVGHPVVGDSFCKHEYSKLKRSIRNRIKSKLCMGCYEVELRVGESGSSSTTSTTTTTTHTIEIPSPDKLSAMYWDKFLKDEQVPKGN